ncbi:uncharacterized protein WCC33_012769 [Rhinophrynus dorsalis]
MLKAKKKLKKKGSKKLSSTEVQKKPLFEPVQLPPPILGEKLLAVLQDWKNETKNITTERDTPEQDTKELRLVFKCVDSNNKGFLNEAEVQRALELLGFVINKQGQEQINKWITSYNGRLGFSAFQELITDWHGVTRNFYKELKKGFSMIDYDKDGKITKDDLRKASMFAGINFSYQELEAMVEEADQNGDHAVDINEFIEIMLKTNLF